MSHEPMQGRRYRRKEKFECPFCGHGDSIVMQGWRWEQNDAYIRRRKCQKCSKLYRTEERVQARYIRYKIYSQS